MGRTRTMWGEGAVGGLKAELAAEHEAWNLLQHEGMDLGYYELFHLVRAENNKYCVSNNVVERGFRP